MLAISSCKCVRAMPTWLDHHHRFDPGFSTFDPAMRDLHWTSLGKKLVCKMTAQGSHRAIRTWGRGLPGGNGMPGDQRRRRFFDLTSGCRVTSSCRSHENVVQGHLGHLGPGAKNQTEQRDCMPSAPASVYRQCRRGWTTITGSVQGLAELTRQCEICNGLHWAKN